jgi:hypothetical protein
LKLGKRLYEDLVSLRVGVGLSAIHSVNLRVNRLQRSQHVVERAVLHHEHDNVFQSIEAWGHKFAPFVGTAGTFANPAFPDCVNRLCESCVSFGDSACDL